MKFFAVSFETIEALTKSRSLGIIVKEYFKGSDMVLALPFLSVINLVKRREVPLRRGFAYVPVTSLLEILVPLFESTLRYGMKLAVQKFATVKEDIRIRRLCLQLKVCTVLILHHILISHFRYLFHIQLTTFVYFQAMFMGKCPSLTSICPKYHLKCDDIDQASSAFPLCMSLLHMTLRKKHRLSHSARVSTTDNLSKKMTYQASPLNHLHYSVTVLEREISNSSKNWAIICL